MTILRKFALGSGLAAAALATTTPAMADEGRWRHYGHGDTAGAAVAGGIIGLALGAAIASSSRDRGYYDSYYDRGYYPRYRTYYVYRDGPYYDHGWRRGWDRGWHHHGYYDYDRGYGWRGRGW